MKNNMYYKIFQSCKELTTCPDFSGGKEEKENNLMVSKNNIDKLPEAQKFDDFNWDDNMNDAY